MNVSPNFSPKIELMKPYFFLSAGFYFLSMLWLFFMNPLSDFTDFTLIGWVHLYMIGFVMMAFFSAMSQLGPIVIESAHYNVQIFKYLWVLLTLGLVLLLIGFYKDITFLLYGGSFILMAMLIYAVEFLQTLRKSKRKTAITKAMSMSNISLIIGISTGLVMAMGFNNKLAINPEDFLKMHTFGLIVGFVILLIMGISLVLIPMFGFSKRISDNEFKSSFYTLTLGVTFMLLSPFFLPTIFENLSYFFTIIAISLFFYQLFKMTESRKRIVHDIWAKSMYVAYSSFLFAFIILITYLLSENSAMLRVGMWLLFIGFFGFVIMGNFYKIIPFLVWFHIYSPLIETQSVPMLHELLPNRLATLQWFFSLSGLVLTTIAIALLNQKLFIGGVLLLSSASLIFFIIIIKLLKLKI